MKLEKNPWKLLLNDDLEGVTYINNNPIKSGIGLMAQVEQSLTGAYTYSPDCFSLEWLSEMLGIPEKYFGGNQVPLAPPDAIWKSYEGGCKRLIQACDGSFLIVQS